MCFFFIFLFIFSKISVTGFDSVVKNIEDGKNLTSDNLLLHAQFSGEVSGACSMFDA